jgi:hypothetical protein
MLMQRKVDWSKWDVKLGEMPDGWIAAQVGVTRQAVEHRRRLKGIAASSTTSEVHAAVQASVMRVFKKAPRMTRLPVREIHLAVIDDYGSVAVRTIHRHLRELVAKGAITVIREPGTRSVEWGYRLAGGRR